ncbi:MAG: hypothetical protein MUE85_10190 [Microscillaceae bacterium]|jgi:hypothetical protein|nr:hypothetical protein [Microscillaceae bacterium]
MTISNIQNELKTIIANDKIEQYFEFCHNILGKSTQIYNSLIALQGQFYDLKNQKKDQIITNEEANIRKNRLRLSLLSLIGEISISDLENSDISLQDIEDLKRQTISHNPTILVICPSEDEIEEVKYLFDCLKFDKTEVRYLNKFVPVQQYDLIIFDNRDLPYCPQETNLDKLSEKMLVEQRVNLMNKYIDKGFRPIVHWGEILYWVNYHREKVHAANSKFSLFARIKEVLDFMAVYHL